MGNKSNTASQSIADLVHAKEPDEVKPPDPVEQETEFDMTNIPETPHRCEECNRLLFKGEVGVGGIVEVKCGKCGTLNTFRVHMIAENFQDHVYKNRAHRYGK